jgi:hypothetical protein
MSRIMLARDAPAEVATSDDLAAMGVDAKATRTTSHSSRGFRGLSRPSTDWRLARRRKIIAR